MKTTQNQALLIDERSRSLSVTLTTTVQDYLSFIKKSYADTGGLEGQRAPLKTKTAIKIRARMIEDLHAGAVLPPIVIGVVPRDDAAMDSLRALAAASKIDELAKELESIGPDRVAIIDGMQRTTALLDASEKAQGQMNDRPVRLEVWIARKTNSLIYRMLVLNTGQVPWDIKRQLETVYTFLLKEIQQKVVNVTVFKLDDLKRRSSSGQYQSSVIIESYFAFTSRKPIVDVKERVAEDFARLDATESASSDENLDRFIEVLRLLAELDEAFSRYTVPKGAGDPNTRFSEGKDIFAVRAAVAGFVSAAAVYIFGEPGFDKQESEIADNTKALTESVSGLVAKLNAMTPDAVGEFIQLDVLGQRLERTSGGVGDFEREVFQRAFLSALKHGERLPSMLPCWRASWDV